MDEAKNNGQVPEGKVKMLFIDTLVTGMQPSRCGIYALGGIICEDTPDRTVEKCRFEMRINPKDGLKINDGKLWISGTRLSDLSTFQKEGDARAWLTAILDKHVNMRNPADKMYLAGYNVSGLDIPFLREWFRRTADEQGRDHFYDYFSKQPMDVMILARYAMLRSERTLMDFQQETVAQNLGVDRRWGEVYSCLDSARESLDIWRKLKPLLGAGEEGPEPQETHAEKNYDPSLYASKGVR
jgi:hypothetical protein